MSNVNLSLNKKKKKSILNTNSVLVYGLWNKFHWVTPGNSGVDTQRFLQFTSSEYLDNEFVIKDGWWYLSRLTNYKFSHHAQHIKSIRNQMT